MVHIYIGDGKGKTTAAIGLAVRNIGSGGKVLFAQFLKNMFTGELNILKDMDGLVLKRPVMRHKTFIWNMSPSQLEETGEDIINGFRDICEAAVSGDYTLIVLDEILDTVSCGFLAETNLIRLIESCPRTEFVLTGREASEKLKDIADYITVMRKEKHPFDKGTGARKGIEY